jgi:hypothetical protein
MSLFCATARIFQEHVQATHQHQRRDCRCDITFRQENLTDLIRHTEADGKRLGIRTPDQEGDILQHHRHPETADDHAHAGHRVAPAGTGKTPVEYPLDNDSQETGHDHCAENSQPVGNVVLMCKHQPEKRAEHVNLAMREVHDVETGVNQRNAERHDPVHHTDGDPENQKS